MVGRAVAIGRSSGGGIGAAVTSGSAGIVGRTSVGAAEGTEIGSGARVMPGAAGSVASGSGALVARSGMQSCGEQVSLVERALDHVERWPSKV